MSSQELGCRLKVVLIGDSGVGKSCIIDRFIKGVYDKYTESSNKECFASKTIEIPEIGKSITLDVWDTVGQERYRSLAKFFYKDAQMVILVFDMTRRNTYDSMINSWYNGLKENGDPNIVIGIAANKSDLYEEEAVSENEAKDFAKSIGAIFCLTSAQNNNGIDQLFKDVTRKYLDPSYPNIESNIKKPKQKEEPNQNTKISEKDDAKKIEKQKKKKKFCIII